MMHPRFVQNLRLTVAAMAVVATLSPDRAVAHTPIHARHRLAMATHSRYAPGSSLVHCTLLQQPRRASRRAVSHRAVRFFAPTSQAVFFTHAGDRCVWHAGAAVRG